MSCIQKLLELKGDKEVLELLPDRVVLETGGNYKGYDYCIVFTDIGHRCGYVAVSANHPILNNREDEYDVPVEVHGGVTFCKTPKHLLQILGDHHCGDIWIGFDAGHANDKPDLEATERYFPNTETSFIKRVMAIDALYTRVVRTKEYMEKECKSVINQIVDHK